MNREEIKKKIEVAIDCQIYERGYATCVDTLIKIGWLLSKNEQAWRKGQVSYLERVITVNLGGSKYFLDCYRRYAIQKEYSLKWTYEKQIGSKTQLRFTKSREPNLERLFASHIVCMQRKAVKLNHN